MAADESNNKIYKREPFIYFIYLQVRRKFKCKHTAGSGVALEVPPLGNTLTQFLVPPHFQKSEFERIKTCTSYLKSYSRHVISISRESLEQIKP